MANTAAAKYTNEPNLYRAETPGTTTVTTYPTPLIPELPAKTTFPYAQPAYTSTPKTP